jgi:hypothetical protein
LSIITAALIWLSEAAVDISPLKERLLVINRPRDGWTRIWD